MYVSGCERPRDKCDGIHTYLLPTEQQLTLPYNVVSLQLILLPRDVDLIDSVLENGLNGAHGFLGSFEEGLHKELALAIVLRFWSSLEGYQHKDDARWSPFSEREIAGVFVLKMAAQSAPSATQPVRVI